MTRRWRLSLSALLLSTALSVSAAHVSRPPVDIFAAGPVRVVSTVWGKSIHGTLAGMNSLSQVKPLTAQLKSADADSPALEPIARVLTAWGYDAESFGREEEQSRRLLVEEAAEAAARAVQNRVREWTADGVLNALPPRERREQFKRMREVADLLPMYAGTQLPRLKGAVRWLDESLSRQLEGAVVKNAGRTLQALDLSVAHVEGLERALEKARGREAAKIVAGLAVIGRSPETSEAVSVAAAQALVNHLPQSYGLKHGQRVVAAALAVGLSRPSVELQDVVVQGLVRDLDRRSSPAAVHDAEGELKAMAAVAQASGNVRIKAIAFRAARALSFGTSKLARAAQDVMALTAVAGPVPSPGAWQDAPVEKGILRKMGHALSWSYLNTLILGGVVFSLAAALSGSGLTTGGLLLSAAFSAAIGVAGRMNHRFPESLVHAAFITAVFAAAGVLAMATGPLGLAGYAFTAAYAALMSGVAIGSWRLHRPMWGLAINVVLLLLF